MFTRERLGSGSFRKSTGNTSTDHDEDEFDDPSEMCRICHGARGVLMAPCFCRGTLALVHRACLERWLSECGSDFCELCGFHFNVQRVPKHSLCGSLVRWLATGLDVKQLALDILSFCVLTPMAMIAVYLVTLSMRSLVEPKPFTSHRAPFMLMLSLFSSTLVLVSYYTWLVAVAQQHAGDWYRWWHTNHTVRVLDVGLRPGIMRQVSVTREHGQSEIGIIESVHLTNDLDNMDANVTTEEELQLASMSYDQTGVEVVEQQEENHPPLASTADTSEIKPQEGQLDINQLTAPGKPKNRKVITKVRKPGTK